MSLRGYNPLMTKKHLSSKRTNKILMILLIIVASAALLLAIYFLPPVHERLSWRLENLRAKIFYFFNPPGEDTFSPEQQSLMDALVESTMTAMAPTATLTTTPTVTPTNYVSPTPTPTPTVTATPTPIPDKARLEGVVHEFQDFNNCGPANLSMALSYWGWEGDQTTTAAWLKPNPDDRNVMPYEMVDYVNTQTSFAALMRYGGDMELVKAFIAAGFPVLVERGFEDEVPNEYWMGHYALLTAYDDSKNQVLIQDSYVAADYAYTYERLTYHWQAFNYLYIVIYPPDREGEVLDILGPHADETYNLQAAAEKALAETETKTGDSLFFAWFNYGTNLMYLQDYFAAAQAYDQAFAVQKEIYPNFNHLWRMPWYQPGPYFAYYYTGRYQDVIDLATDTLNNASNNPAIEESWVWRGRARLALGDMEGAISDFRKALVWHPGWWVAEAELRNLGLEP